MRKISPTSLYNSAVYYLQRYAASSGYLREVMQRKMKRWQMNGLEIPSEALQWIDEVVEKCINLGFVNDRLYAESKVNELRRAGRSHSYITRALQQKGVSNELLAEFLGHDSEAELTAARRHIQRRRLGRDTTPEGKQKDLARLARAGFSLAVAKQALQSTGDE